MYRNQTRNDELGEAMMTSLYCFLTRQIRGELSYHASFVFQDVEIFLIPIGCSFFEHVLYHIKHYF